MTDPTVYPDFKKSEGKLMKKGEILLIYISFIIKCE